MIIIVIGIALRLVIGTFLTYTYDVHSWALIISNFESGNGLYDVAGYNYAPPWGYILGSISVIGEFFGVDLFGERFTDALPIEQYTDWFYTSFVTSIEFNLMVKAALFVFDLIAGYLLYWIVLNRTDDPRKAVIGFGLWFLCPFVIAVSSVGGMFDSLTAILTMLCIIFLMKDRYLLAGMMLGTATILKLFPGLLLFVLVAYVFLKNRNNGLAIRRTVEAAIGALMMIAVLLMPQILDGTLSDCFAFITSRATNNIGSGLGDIERYGTIIAYLGILFVSILLARHTYKSNTGDANGLILTIVLLNLAVLFLYPSAPQYMLLITPFIILQTILVDRRYFRPLLILMIGTTMFALSANVTNLISIAEYTNITSVDSVLYAMSLFQKEFLGISATSIMYYGGAVIQYIGTVMIPVTYYMLYVERTNESMPTIR